MFFGIVPIIGVQMVVAAAVAHRLRLNMAIALLASNISIPPIAPFIHVGALLLGHWIFTGDVLEISRSQMTWAHAREYFWHWLFGCMVLAVVVAALGMILTYAAARIWRWLAGKPVNPGDLAS